MTPQDKPPAPPKPVIKASGLFRFYFNRHQAYPLVWCIAGVQDAPAAGRPEVPWEVAAAVLDLRVPVRSHYRQRLTKSGGVIDDNDDGIPSAWFEAAGELEVGEDGVALVTAPAGAPAAGALVCIGRVVGWAGNTATMQDRDRVEWAIQASGRQFAPRTLRASARADGEGLRPGALQLVAADAKLGTVTVAERYACVTSCETDYLYLVVP